MRVVVYSEFLAGGESPVSVWAATARAVRLLRHPPSVIAYDMACQVYVHLRQDHVVPADAQAVSRCTFVVPRFLERTHPSCPPDCVTACRVWNYPELTERDGRTSVFNTSRAEQHFRSFARMGVGRLRNALQESIFLLACVEEELNFRLVA